MPTVRSPIPVDDELVLLSARERREGAWTKLELIEMDRRFCAAMRRAYSSMKQPGDLERRRRAG